ncbi:MAG TPA: hypothetical protein VMG82_16905 [Candidatus Sulfotelmatobacter sp.]|nr:hypothetical protein [Candidatus Sulfotelmatobacter sp.]
MSSRTVIEATACNTTKAPMDVKWKYLPVENSISRCLRPQPQVTAGVSRAEVNATALCSSHRSPEREKLAELVLTFGAFALPHPEPVRLSWSTGDLGKQALNRRELSQ